MNTPLKLADVLLVAVQFLFIILFFLVPSGPAAGRWIQGLSFVLAFLGIITSFAAVFNLGKALTPFPTPNNSNLLVTTGIYKFIRHPIYTGITIIMTGISLYSMNIPRGIITGLLLILFYYKSHYEEKLLIIKFKDYAQYKRITGRFFPKLF